MKKSEGWNLRISSLLYEYVDYIGIPYIWVPIEFQETKIYYFKILKIISNDL